jgi:hypothetical protein
MMHSSASLKRLLFFSLKNRRFLARAKRRGESCSFESRCSLSLSLRRFRLFASSLEGFERKLFLFGGMVPFAPFFTRENLKRSFSLSLSLEREEGVRVRLTGKRVFVAEGKTRVTYIRAHHRERERIH